MSGYDATLLVRNNGVDESNTLSFHINPLLDYVPIFDKSLYDCLQYDNRCDTDNWTFMWDAQQMKTKGFIFGTHNAGMWSGHKGDDKFRYNMPIDPATGKAVLKNGWRFSKVVLNKEGLSGTVVGPNGDADARLDEISTDAQGRPIARIHWFCNPQYDSTWLYYYATFWIEGPKGYPYQ